MIAVTSLATNVCCRLVEVTNRSFVLPLLVFYPTSRCNSRCMSCDWWKSTGEDDLAVDEIAAMVGSLSALKTRRVVLSGGEPLLRAEIFDIATLFCARGAKLQLLTSGLWLERYAARVVELFDRITISLDGSTAASYQAIRGVPGLSTIEAGVSKVKALAPRIPITARATLHSANFRELPGLVEKAKEMRLNGISFLAADVSSTAFGRTSPPQGDGLLLGADELREFRAVIGQTEREYADDFASGFIAESPEKLQRLPRYYAAMRGEGGFPEVSCNAPWVSVVVEANGAVRPCFFHRSIGNVRQKPLLQIIREDLPAFRRELDVSANPVCERCVCSLKVGLRSDLW